METHPIWEHLDYVTWSASPIEYRILTGADFGEEIFRGRAVPSPTNEIRIRFNLICADYINSVLMPEFISSALTEDTAVPMDSYREFRLETYSDSLGIWETAEEAAFTNDTSYSGREDSSNFSEPINGHAAPGQILPQTWLITGTTEERCYNIE